MTLSSRVGVIAHAYPCIDVHTVNCPDKSAAMADPFHNNATMILYIYIYIYVYMCVYILQCHVCKLNAIFVLPCQSRLQPTPMSPSAKRTIHSAEMLLKVNMELDFSLVSPLAPQFLCPCDHLSILAQSESIKSLPR